MFAPTETSQLGINKNENIFYSRILHATSTLYSFSRTVQSGLSSVESAQHVLYNKCSLRFRHFQTFLPNAGFRKTLTKFRNLI